MSTKKDHTSWYVLAALLAILVMLMASCAVADASKARAIKKIGKLDQRKRGLQAKYGIGTVDTVYYTDTVILGSFATDTVVFWNYGTDTIYSQPDDVIKWKIIREPGDTVRVPYRVQIECPSDTVNIKVALPCPDVTISKWERLYSNVFLTLRRWWWIGIIVGCIYLVLRYWEKIKGYIPWL